jgi:hypothetical protein
MISACRPAVNKSPALTIIRRRDGANRIEKIDIVPRAMQNAREAEGLPTQI